MDLPQLFEYNRLVRRAYVDALAKLTWEEVVKNREASFHSMRNVLLHTLDVEERLIHYLIRDRMADWVRRNFDEFDSIGAIKSRMLRTDEETARIIVSLSADDLSRAVVFPRRERPSVQLTVEDVLIQNLTEQLHHRGELIALLWQMDIEPPEMQWTWYVEEANLGRTDLRKPLTAK